MRLRVFSFGRTLFYFSFVLQNAARRSNVFGRKQVNAMERFEKTVCDVLRALVACGERLSNEAEERAFDVLEAAYRRAGAQTHRERIPIFVSTADASIRAGAAAIESPEVEGNAMTHPLEDGAPGDFTISAKGPLLALDRQAREALARGEAAFDGAVLLVEGLPSLGLLRAAQAAGAAALLFNTGERVRRMIVSDLWGSPAGDEDIARYVRIPNAAVTDAAAKRLLAAAQTGEAVELENRVHSGWRMSTVLTGAVGCSPLIDEATADGKPRFLLTGHMDSWGAGAVDNASGLAVTAGVLEALAARKDALRAGAMAVAWSGHSHGRYAGSAAWSERHGAALSRSVFLNINVDCLGMRESVVNGKMPLSACAALLARRSLRAAGIDAPLQPTRFSRSCDQSFYAAGVPTVFSNVAEVPAEMSGVSLAVAGLGGVYGPHWHTRADDLDAIAPEALLRDGTIILKASLAAAGEGAAALSIAAEAEDCADEANKALSEVRAQLNDAKAWAEAAGLDETAACLAGFAASPVFVGIERAIQTLRDARRMDSGDEETRMARLHALVNAGYAEDELGFGLAGSPTRNRLAAANVAFRRVLGEVSACSTQKPPAAQGMRLLTAAQALHRSAGLLLRALERAL